MSEPDPPRFSETPVEPTTTSEHAAAIEVFRAASGWNVDERVVRRVWVKLGSAPVARPRWVLALAVAAFAVPALAWGVSRYLPQPEATPRSVPGVESPTTATLGRVPEAPEQTSNKSEALPLEPQELAPLAAGPAPTSRQRRPDVAARDTLQAESDSLAHCLATLRRGDARAALAEVSAHQARFPRGPLRTEATLVRIDALRALGQQSELLALLDTKRLSTFPRAAELRVLRGQLRAAAHRCSEAAADLGEKPSVADQRLLQACRLRSAQGN